MGALEPLVVDDGEGVCASIPVLDVAARPPLGEEVAEEGLDEAELVGGQGGKTAIVLLQQASQGLELLLDVREDGLAQLLVLLPGQLGPDIPVGVAPAHRSLGESSKDILGRILLGSQAQDVVIAE